MMHKTPQFNKEDFVFYYKDGEYLHGKITSIYECRYAEDHICYDVLTRKENSLKISYTYCPIVFGDPVYEL